MANKGKLNGWAIALIVVLMFATVASLGWVAYFVADKTMKGQTLGDPEIDQDHLYIGVPHYQEGDEVKLILIAKSGSASKQVIYSSTNTDQMKKLEGQDATTVYLDYAAAPIIDLGGQSIGKWLADSNNSIHAMTSCLGTKITSSEVGIDLPGIWFVNCAAKDGAEPYNWSAGKNHSYITKTTVYGTSEEA